MTTWLACVFAPKYGCVAPGGDSGIITQADPRDPAAAKDGDSAPRVAGPLSIPAISYRRPRS